MMNPREKPSVGEIFREGIIFVFNHHMCLINTVYDNDIKAHPGSIFQRKIFHFLLIHSLSNFYIFSEDEQ